MIGAQELLERRLLAALEAAARVELPAPWGALRPQRDDSLRQASAVLLRIAQLKDCAAMAARLRQAANDVAGKRGGRAGGEQELWPKVASALESLDALRPGAQGLLGLALWGPRIPLAELASFQRGLPPGEGEPRKDFLTAAARTLLRALARNWTEAARRKEKKERGG